MTDGTTMQMPMVNQRPRRRISMLAVIVVIGGLAVIGLKLVSRMEVKQSENRQAVFAADVNAGKLSTPDAYQALCGRAQKQWQDKQGTFLQYGNLIVRFHDGQVSFGDNVLGGRTSSRIDGETVGADFASSYCAL